MRTNTLWVIVGVSLFTGEARPCSVTGIISNVDMVKAADAVVRGRAVEYARSPKSLFRTTGVPDSKVRFQVLENVRGLVLKDVVLPGYLVSGDDYNDEDPPYSFVRPGGRAGNCFANSYRGGGEYLLFLKRTRTGELTVNWAALAPVNEQLRSADDPWVVWVRAQAAKLPGTRQN